MISLIRNRFLSLGRSSIEKGLFFLSPLSLLWGIFVFCKNRLYDRKWLKPKRVGAVVVSIGNIVAGGTGKTPFVLLLAKAFQKRKVAILTRGYGEIPDEALLFRRRLPNIPVYIGKNRKRLALQAVQEGAELLILDDGFQHRKLHRDFDIVLALADDPFGKGRFLPWGFLRDHPKRLRQADALFIQGRDFRHAPSRILNEREEAIASIRGWKVGLFCGIAHPRFFKKMIEALGADVKGTLWLADHEKVTPQALEKFARRCLTLGAQGLITTEKDFVKNPKASLPILFVEVDLEWLQREDQWGNLIAKIDQKLENRKI